MKNIWPKIKRLAQVLAGVGLGVLFIVILSSAIKQQNEIICSEVLVRIDYSSGNHFLDESDVLRRITGSGQKPIIGKVLKDIDLSRIESDLHRNPFVRKAEVYTNLNGSMIVQILQKQPILRIINNQGVSYYLSDKGERIPLSDKFTPRLAVATGNIKAGLKTAGAADSVLLMDLQTLQLFIRSDAFWDAAIEQINVADNQEIELIPKIGNHTVLLGSVDSEFKEKMHKLKVFYEEGIGTVGWDKYKTINLKYKDQIVCTKK